MAVNHSANTPVRNIKFLSDINLFDLMLDQQRAYFFRLHFGPFFLGVFVEIVRSQILAIK